MATESVTLAITLRQTRKAAGLTQRQAADCCGVPLSSYQGYEQGKSVPDYDRGQAMLVALGAAVGAPSATGGGDPQPGGGVAVRSTVTMLGAGTFYVVLHMNGQPFYRFRYEFRCEGEPLNDVDLHIGLDAFQGTGDTPAEGGTG